MATCTIQFREVIDVQVVPCDGDPGPPCLQADERYQTGDDCYRIYNHRRDTWEINRKTALWLHYQIMYNKGIMYLVKI